MKYLDLGIADYKKTWDLQTVLLKEMVVHKKSSRDRQDPIPQIHRLILCEHHPVITVGKNGKLNHLTASRELLDKMGIGFYEINRGGDITYHGPGQITGYPIFDLDEFFTDVHRYVRFLEEVVIRVLQTFQLEGKRYPGFTGVWLGEKVGVPSRKICAIGVHLSRWVTMHGFALNVNTNLNHFNYLIPCGIIEPGLTVTSLEKELGHKVEIELVKTLLVNAFQEVFQCEFV